MTIPNGIPTVLMVVKNGRGGPNKDSIPVFEDLGGPITAYLKNDTIVQVVADTYPDLARYRRQWNGSFYRQFVKEDGTDLVPGEDGWCEENSHLFPVAPVFIEEETYEILEESWINGKRFLKVRKI